MGAGVVVAGLAVLHAHAAAWELNADGIYPLVFVRDRLAHGFGGGRWIVPPASGFVPDLVLTFLGLALGFDGYRNVAFVYAGFCVALALAGAFFLRAAGLRRESSLAAAVVSVALLVLCQLRPQEGLSRLYLSPAHHQLALPFALAGFALLFIAKPWARAALLPLTALGVVSDPILVTELALPAAGLCIVTRREPLGTAAVIVGAGFGLTLRPLLERALNFEHGTYGSHVTAAGVARSFAAFFGGLPGFLAASSPWRGTLGLVALAALAMLSRHSRLALAAVLVTACGVLGPLVSGTYTEPSFFRQQLPLFFVPGLAAAGIAAERLSSLRLGAAACLATLASVATSAARLPHELPFQYRHAELLARLQWRGVSGVAAEYWEAKPLVLLSDFRLPVCSISTGLRPYAWSTNLLWCDFLRVRPSSKGPFAVVGERLTESRVLAEFGSPFASEDVAGFRVWYYPAARIAAALTPGPRAP